MMNSMKTIKIVCLLAIVLVNASLLAQQTADVKYPTLFESLATPDSATKATVIVHQDKRIEQMIVSKRISSNSKVHSTASGYRVQVFSSNTQRTAKSEAFKIEKQINDMYPNERVYVNYTSPFWKVRVGDFGTMAEAQVFRSEIIKAFPDMRSETYIVREQINISGSK